MKAFLSHFMLFTFFKFNNLNFYTNNTNINSICYNKSFYENSNFFSFTNKTIFVFQNNFFDKEYCSYLFYNSQLLIINIRGIIDTFFVKNSIKYLDILNDSSISINSNIYQLDVYGYEMKIESSFLNKQVFENTEIITLVGSLQFINEGENICLLKSKFIHYFNLFNYKSI